MSLKLQEMLDFIHESPVCFFAAANVRKRLLDEGYEELKTLDGIRAGGKYFLTRNNSALIAFRVPAGEAKGFMISAAHSDSPCLKIRDKAELDGGVAIRLDTERYGGMINACWVDRPLSVAGRVMVRTEKGVAVRLVDLKKDMALIPNMAIHMNREANEGRKIDVQAEIHPVLSLDGHTTLVALLAETARVAAEDILSSDLYVYNRSAPSRWGAEGEFISAPRLDDLECVWGTAQGFLAAAEKQELPAIPVWCLFDNEEVGSSSRQGADSTFLSDTLERLAEKIGLTGEAYKIALAKSIMVSADNAHALHPNYVSSADPVNRPRINGGIVIKYNAAQKYTTDAETSAFFKLVCEKAGVPWQVFTNNSNVAGGSTLGNISQNHVSVPSVDIGLAQWAMHSPYETAGALDVERLVKATALFYSF